MSQDFESVELDVSEDDIVYYLFDEDDNEIGFVIEEDGKEVECYYEWVNTDDYVGLDAQLVDEGESGPGETVEAIDEGAAVEPDPYPDQNEAGGEDGVSVADLADFDGEVVEMEIDEDAIDHYLFDTDGNEVGFVIIEDGVEVECYYQDDDDDEGDDEDDAEALADAEPEERGYLYKMARIAGFEGNKARKRAGEKLGQARDKAAPVVNAARSKAEEGVEKATEAVESGGKKLKEKQDEYDLGITREDVTEATADLNAIAKEGAATAKELKEAYDDIMDSFGFLMPKGVRRKLP